MEVFVQDDKSRKFSGWYQTLEFLLNTLYQSCGSIVKEEEEKEILQHLLFVLLKEYGRRQDPSYEVIMHSVMKTILSVLARNMILSPPIEALVVFIRQHIFQPECLRIKYLAE